VLGGQSHLELDGARRFRLGGNAERDDAVAALLGGAGLGGDVGERRRRADDGCDGCGGKDGSGAQRAPANG
jgi:hypothetical protein